MYLQSTASNVEARPDNMPVVLGSKLALKSIPKYHKERFFGREKAVAWANINELMSKRLKRTWRLSAVTVVIS